MSARKLTIAGLATLTLLSCGLAATPAVAALTEYSFVRGFGSFSGVQSIAVDEATGDVYVYDVGAGALYKFDAAGEPAEFSASKADAIEGIGGSTAESEVAVDNSNGPAKGDIYIANRDSVTVYAANGSVLGELNLHGAGGSCGVAVDATGSVYVGFVGGSVEKYTPIANPVTSSDFVSSLSLPSNICDIAADSQGDVYVDTLHTGPVTKYLASQFGGIASGSLLAPTDSTLAVAQRSGEVYVDAGGEVTQYDANGGPLGTIVPARPNAIEGSIGVAVNAKNGRLYVSSGAAGTVEIWQGVQVATTLTGTATQLTPVGGATLGGTTNPEESSVGTCSFEYGLEASYGSSSPCAQATPMTGDTPFAVSAELSGLSPNTTYHYRLVTDNERGSARGADRTFAIPVLAKVDDQAPSASNVGRTSALLSATVDPEGPGASFHFDYGTSSSYGLSTPVTASGASLQDLAVSQSIDELAPSTTYHYRLVVKNFAGTAVGPDEMFTTVAPTPPSVTTGEATQIGPNAATIAGTVDSKGLQGVYGFQIAIAGADYGPPTGLTGIGAGGGATNVTLALTGLLPGSSYHYRIVASNVDGTSYGAEATFATGSFPNVFATPPAPLPLVAIPTIVFPPQASASKTAKPKAKKQRTRRKPTKAKQRGGKRKAHGKRKG
jgi:hypothetical protein